MIGTFVPGGVGGLGPVTPEPPLDGKYDILVADVILFAPVAPVAPLNCATVNKVGFEVFVS